MRSKEGNTGEFDGTRKSVRILEPSKGTTAAQSITTHQQEPRSTADQRKAFRDNLYTSYAELHHQAEELRERKHIIDYDLFASNSKEIHDLLFEDIGAHDTELGDWDTYERVELIVKKFAYGRPHYEAADRDELAALKERATTLSHMVVSQRRQMGEQHKSMAALQEEISGLLNLIRMKNDEIRQLTVKSNTCMLQLRQAERECRALRDPQNANSHQQQLQICADLKLLIEANKKLEKTNSKLCGQLHAKSETRENEAEQREKYRTLSSAFAEPFGEDDDLTMRTEGTSVSGRGQAEELGGHGASARSEAVSMTAQGLWQQAAIRQTSLVSDTFVEARNRLESCLERNALDVQQALAALDYSARDLFPRGSQTLGDAASPTAGRQQEQRKQSDSSRRRGTEREETERTSRAPLSPTLLRGETDENSSLSASERPPQNHSLTAVAAAGAAGLCSDAVCAPNENAQQHQARDLLGHTSFDAETPRNHPQRVDPVCGEEAGRVRTFSANLHDSPSSRHNSLSAGAMHEASTDGVCGDRVTAHRRHLAGKDVAASSQHSSKGHSLTEGQQEYEGELGTSDFQEKEESLASHQHFSNGGRNPLATHSHRVSENHPRETSRRNIKSSSLSDGDGERREGRSLLSEEHKARELSEDDAHRTSLGGLVKNGLVQTPRAASARRGTQHSSGVVNDRKAGAAEHWPGDGADYHRAFASMKLELRHLREETCIMKDEMGSFLELLAALLGSGNLRTRGAGASYPMNRRPLPLAKSGTAPPINAIEVGEERGAAHRSSVTQIQNTNTVSSERLVDEATVAIERQREEMTSMETLINTVALGVVERITEQWISDILAERHGIHVTGGAPQTTDSTKAPQSDAEWLAAKLKEMAFAEARRVALDHVAEGLPPSQRNFWKGDSGHPQQVDSSRSRDTSDVRNAGDVVGDRRSRNGGNVGGDRDSRDAGDVVGDRRSRNAGNVGGDRNSRDPTSWRESQGAKANGGRIDVGSTRDDTANASYHLSTEMSSPVGRGDASAFSHDESDLRPRDVSSFGRQFGTRTPHFVAHRPLSHLDSRLSDDMSEPRVPPFNHAAQPVRYQAVGGRYAVPNPSGHVPLHTYERGVPSLDQVLNRDYSALPRQYALRDEPHGGFGVIASNFRRELATSPRDHGDTGEWFGARETSPGASAWNGLQPVVVHYKLQTALSRAIQNAVFATRRLFQPDIADAVARAIAPVATAAASLADGQHPLGDPLLLAVRQLRRNDEICRKARTKLLFRRVATNIRVRHMLHNPLFHGNAFVSYLGVLYERWRLRLEEDRRRLAAMRYDHDTNARLRFLLQEHFALPSSAAPAIAGFGTLPPLSGRHRGRFPPNKRGGTQAERDALRQKSSNHFDRAAFPTDPGS